MRPRKSDDGVNVDTVRTRSVNELNHDVADMGNATKRKLSSPRPHSYDPSHVPGP